MNKDALPGLKRLQAGSKLRAKLRPVDWDEYKAGPGAKGQNSAGYLGLVLRRKTLEGENLGRKTWPGQSASCLHKA